MGEKTMIDSIPAYQLPDKTADTENADALVSFRIRAKLKGRYERIQKAAKKRKAEQKFSDYISDLIEAAIEKTPDPGPQDD